MYIVPNKRASRPDRRSYNGHLEIGMTRPALPILSRLQKQYGGNLNETRKKSKKWATAWSWKVSGSRAAEILAQLLPHMEMKKPHARCIVALEEIRQSLIPEGGTYARWTEEASKQGEFLRQTILMLNKKGPNQVILEPESFALLVDSQWGTPQFDLFASHHSEPFSETWPSSGMGTRGVCWTASTSEYPRDAAVCSLSDILEPEVDAKYFLSPKACRGILRRAEKRGKELPCLLRQALERTAKGAEPSGPKGET